jgi:ankyrin repeat protein
MVQRRLEIEICHAVAKGNLQPLRTVLNNPQRKFNPNILDESNSMSLLMLACSQGDVELVKTLIAAGADVNYISANRRSVLHIAVDHNQPAVVTALLQAGANPMQQAANSAMPLHDAVWSNRVECVKALLPAYKSINYSPDGAHNGLPLNLAIDRGWSTIVQLFIDTGMDLNTCKYGTPPLIHAAASGKANIVQQLLRAGADVNAHDAQGLTPLLALPYVHDLRIPQQYSCAPIIRLLAEAGADLNACDSDGYTRIELMLRRGNLSLMDRECVMLLQQLGCTPRPERLQK